MDERTHLARRGELAAERGYVAHGYRVVARNWRCRLGELDLVLRRGRVLVICEVKTRRGSRYGGGFEAVDARKRQKLRTLAEAYVVQAPFAPTSIRFDVASVWVRADDSATVEVFEDAF